MFQNVSSFICNSPQSMYSNLAQSAQITLQMLLICWNFLCFLPFPSLLSPGILGSKNKAGLNPRAQPALDGSLRPIGKPQEGPWDWKQPGGSLVPAPGWTLGVPSTPNQARMCICCKTTFISTAPLPRSSY